MKLLPNGRSSLLAVVLMGIAVAFLLLFSFYPIISAHRNDRQEVILLGHTNFLAGSTSSVRLVVRDHYSHHPIRGAKVHLALDSPTRGRVVNVKARTDDQGTADMSFITPEEEMDYDFTIYARSSFGKDFFRKSISVTRKYSLLLSTDKPLYQPGQKMTLRCLVLRKPDLKPETGRSVAFEISDGKENKVYIKTVQVNDYGVAWVEFPLADQVNQGRWNIKASLEGVTSEKTVEVKQYTLPKHRVTIETDRSYCGPGDTVRGRVTAEYFFGKPVAGAAVSLQLSTVDVSFHTIGRLTGTTNDEGIFPFEIRLPDYFAGQPLKNGNAYLQFRARVTDKASHREEITRGFTVCSKPFVLEALPESGVLVPGVENVIYFLASYPDGRAARVTIQDGPTVYKTNELGIAEYRFTPRSAGSYQLQVAVFDRTGSRMRFSKTFSTDQQEATGNLGSILLRTSSSMPRVGETLNVTAISSAVSGAVFLDAIRDGQTIYTGVMELESGRADHQIDLSSDWAGTVVLNAYRLGRNTRFVRDTRVLVISNPNDLQVSMKTSKQTYLPGETARMAFMVKDSSGNPCQAALGINIVDEALFALTELHPGLERMFFELERELLQPRFQIKKAPRGITLQDLYLDGFDRPPRRPDSPSGSHGPDDTSRTEGWLPVMDADLRNQASHVLLSRSALKVSYPIMTESYTAKMELRKKGYENHLSRICTSFQKMFGVICVLMLLITLGVRIGIKYGSLDGISTQELPGVTRAAAGQFFSYIFFMIAYALFVAAKPAMPRGGALGLCFTAFVLHLLLTFLVLRRGDRGVGHSPYFIQLLHIVAITGLFIICLVCNTTGSAVVAISKKSPWFITILISYFTHPLVVLASSILAARKRHTHELIWCLLRGVLIGLTVFLVIGSGSRVRGIVLAAAFLSGIIPTVIGLARLHPRYPGTLTAALAHAIQWFLVFATGGIIIPLITEGGAAVPLVFIGAVFGIIVYSVEMRDVKKRKLGVSLVNIMILLMVVGILGAIAIPDFNRARLQSSGMTMRERQRIYEEIHGADGETSGGSVMAPPADFSEPGAKDGTKNDEKVRIREYFPETLLSLPCIITDESGRLELDFPVADSITDWRVTASASAKAGGLGALSGSLRVFQDFFVDLDVPGSLTQGDIVSVPAAVFNYLDRPQNVELKLQSASWYIPVDGLHRSIHLEPGDVTSVFFTIKVQQFGDHRLTLHASGTEARDAVRRAVKVFPFGAKKEVVSSGNINETVSTSLTFPFESVPGSEKMYLKVYPSVFTQVVEGLDSLLRVPHGCFEQTSSSTYPNLLVLDYLNKTSKISPKIRMKAEHYVQLGYQRLLTFELSGGGFSWFGRGSAKEHLTAYGLMEFTDMNKVYPVDTRLIKRTRAWLLSQQESDGSWRDRRPKGRSSSLEYANQVYKNTAYITWALTSSGCHGRQVDKALRFLKRYFRYDLDNYCLALAANALVCADKDDPFTVEVIDTLIGRAAVERDHALWSSGLYSVVGSRGRSSTIETTALALLALIGSGADGALTRQGINYLIAEKDARGSWHSTQATILALKVLAQSYGQRMETTASGGAISVRINGQDTDPIIIEPGTEEVVRLMDLADYATDGENLIELAATGNLSPQYQVIGEYYVPWEKEPEKRSPLYIDIEYDRTELTRGDIIKADVTVGLRDVKPSSMIIVDLGIPPGFSLLSEDLERLKNNGAISKYSLTSRQAILYLDGLGPGQIMKFAYRLRARFPVKAKTPPALIYEYYQPERKHSAAPVELKVI